MKIARAVDPDGREAWGSVDLAAGTIALVAGDPFGGAELGARPIVEMLRLGDVRLLPPARPTKILGIGRNYRAHAAELGNDVPAEPLVFLKAPSALAGPGDTVLLPPESARVDWEGELALVVGRRVRRLPAARWAEAILGWTAACDLTARDLQKKDVQFARAKSFDGFCPLGPLLETDLDISGVRLRTRVRGELRQDGCLDDLIFGLPRLVEHLSAAMTLEPGDVILTGTPEGVGALADGDDVEVELDRLGAPLRFRCAAESARH